APLFPNGGASIKFTWRWSGLHAVSIRDRPQSSSNFPLHSRRVRVFDLEPMVCPAGDVPRAAPLRDYPFASESACALENDRARIIEYRIEHDARLATVEQPRQLGLARLDRLTAKVAASISRRSKAMSVTA